MSFQEKRIIASIISTILVFGAYYLIITGMYQAGKFEGGEGSSLVGKSILLLIVGGIIINILMTITLSIVLAIAANEPSPSFVIDERDRLIELRGVRISTYVTGGGFVLSMLALAMGQTPFVVFNLIITAFAMGDLISNYAMLSIYRRGF